MQPMIKRENSLQKLTPKRHKLCKLHTGLQSRYYKYVYRLLTKMVIINEDMENLSSKMETIGR